MLVIIKILTNKYFETTPTIKYKITITHARDNRKINTKPFLITPADIHSVPCPLFQLPKIRPTPHIPNVSRVDRLPNLPQKGTQKYR